MGSARDVAHGDGGIAAVTTAEGPTASGLAAHRLTGPVIVGVVWIALYSWRPLLFGAYSDDWSYALWPAPELTFVDDLTYVASRPVYGLLHQALLLVCGQSVVRWQAASALGTLSAASTFAMTARAFLVAHGLDPLAARFGSAFGAAIYLASPWLLGVTAWPTLGLVTWGTAAFNLSVLCWFLPWPLWQRAAATALFSAVSGLVYECYWLAFVPLLANFAVGSGRAQRRDVVVLGSVLAAVQTCLITFNRYVATIAGTVAKSYNEQLWAAVSVAPYAIRSGLQELFTSSGRLIFLAALALLGLAALWASWRDRRLVRSVAFAGLALVGGIIAIVVFAAAGYGITLRGPFARTTIGLAWWFAFLVAGMTAAVAQAQRHVRRPALFAAIMLLAVCTAGTAVRSRDWIAAWGAERDLLASLPEAALLDQPSASLLALALPPVTDGIGIFQAPWEITGALQLMRPALATHLSATDQDVQGKIATAITPPWYLRSGEGGIEQGFCGQPPIFRFPQRRALVWSYPERMLSIYDPPFSIGCRPLEPQR